MKLPATIWMVEGASGEYSDHVEWPICFFYSEADAKAKVEFLSAMTREAQVIAGEVYDYDRTRKAEAFMKQYDPEWTRSYSGTNYTAYEVKLGGEGK